MKEIPNKLGKIVIKMTGKAASNARGAISEEINVTTDLIQADSLSAIFFILMESIV